MNIIFFGTPEFVIPIAETLKKNFNLVAVVTTPDRPAGRKNVLTAPPIKTWAEKNTILVVQPEQFNNATMHQLSSLNPDLFIVASYGKILPQSVLDIPRLGAINIHPSLLPKFRGTTPVQTSILAGVRDSGVTIIKMDDKMDHGPILTTIPFTIEQNETAQDILQNAFNLAANNLVQTINNSIASNATDAISPIEQDHTQATYSKKLSKQDGFIDLDNPPTPEEFGRMVRAYFPWPGTFTQLKVKNEKLKMIKFLPQNMLQMEGKNPVDKEVFFRGYPEVREKIERLYTS